MPKRPRFFSLLVNTDDAYSVHLPNPHRGLDANSVAIALFSISSRGLLKRVAWTAKMSYQAHLANQQANGTALAAKPFWRLRSSDGQRDRNFESHI